MKHLIIISCSILFFYVAFTAMRPGQPVFSKAAYETALQKKRISTIRCVPDWSTYYLSNEEIQQMIPLPGTGTHTWKIAVKHDSAQFYFNQGMNLYYGFHITEAMPSFKKAQLFDSTSAMLYWAEALAYGPNINDMGYAASPDALTATAKAISLLSSASPKEALLIKAMQVRYSSDTAPQRTTLNERYANKMKALYAAYPADAEIGALYADALMVQHPWDLWMHNGQPKPWTPQIEKVLEHTLAFAPDHPGANHYYIHTMEASPYAYKANASADRLGRLAPGLSHMVHMPSHIYIRTGQYAKGEAVNRAAVQTYLSYLKLYPGVVAGAFLYDNHNRHMQAACSLNGNDYAAAFKDAMACRNAITDTAYLSMPAPLGDYVQYMYMAPELAMVTFKQWTEIVAQPAIPGHHHYASLIQEFAKGMAMANTNNIPGAKHALANMQLLLKEPDMAIVFAPFNLPEAAGKVAEQVLSGTVAEKEKDMKDALRHYRSAVAAEDALIYNEPRDWLISARHFLGNALLNNRQYKEAAKVFGEDLKMLPLNDIAVKGLAAAMRKK